MAPPVPTLQALSLATISKHIWQTQDLSQPLTELCREAAANPDTGIPTDTYFSQIVPIYESIMAIEVLSETVRAQVACAFIKLERNMFNWAKDLLQILKSKRKEDIAYCLTKTVVRINLKVNREKTIFNVLFDSYGRIRFASIGTTCLLTVHNLYKYIESEKYRKHGCLSQKIRRELPYHDPFNYWHLSMVLMQSIFHINHLEMKLLMIAIHYTKVQVFNYLLKKLTNRYNLGTPARIYSQLLFHALLSDNQRETKTEIIIYLLEKLHSCDQSVWIKALTHLFSEIIPHIFVSAYTEYSIKYYRQACEVVSVEDCVYTVTSLLEELRSFSEPYGQTALYLKRRAVFFQIWSHTPLKVRQDMFGFLKNDYLHVWEENDFVLLSILLTDFAFSDCQRAFLLVSKVLAMQEMQKSDIDTFLAHLPERHRGFLDNVTKETLKEYVSLTASCKEKYDDVWFFIKTEAEQNIFKEELLQDKGFVVGILSAMGCDYDEERIMRFLKWILKDDEAIKKFIEEKVIGQQWIVDIMKTYFLSETYTMTDSSLIDFFVVNPEKRREFKKVIRNDTPLILKMLDHMFLNWKSEITTFLPCIFDADETEEQKTLVETYLLSEKGLKAIKSLVVDKDDIKNVDLYVQHSLKSSIHAMHQVKEHWLAPFGLTHKAVEVLSALEIESEYILQFPHESQADGAIITNKKLDLFLLILNEDVNVEDLIEREIPRVNL